MSLPTLNRPLDRGGIAKVLAVLILAAIVLVGGWQVWRHYQGSRALDTAGVREVIRAYLRKQTGERNFSPPLEASTNATPAASTDSAGVEAGAKGIKGNKADKLNKKAPPPTDFARLFRQQIQAAHDYKTIYRAIGQSLALADRFLVSTNPADVEAALALAADASRAAHDSAVNDWLAARIAEGYLWPGLDLDAFKDARRVSADYLLNIAEEAFRNAGETNNLVRNYHLAIAHASHSGKADNLRMRLARELDDQGDPAAALAMLREVKETNSNVLQKRLAGLERRLKDKAPQR